MPTQPLQEIEITEQEYLELSVDVITALHIVTHSYKISINPDFPSMKTREQAMNSAVHIEYRCLKCRTCQDCRESREAGEIPLPV